MASDHPDQQDRCDAQDWHDQQDRRDALEPPNFSWLQENVLSACAFPDKGEHLRFLTDNGITCLVSLTAERAVDKSYITDGKLRVVELPMRDYSPPTIEQVETFIKCVLETRATRQATCVHCAHGLGRTGTMLACYFVHVHGLTSEEALEHVRSLRPGSVETTDQELLVHEFCRRQAAKKGAGHELLKSEGRGGP